MKRSQENEIIYTENIMNTNKLKENQKKESEEWYYRCKSLESQLKNTQEEWEKRVREAISKENWALSSNQKLQDELDSQVKEWKEKTESKERQIQIITEKYASQHVDTSEQAKQFKSEYDQLVTSYKEVKAERDLLKLENQVLQNMQLKTASNNSKRETPWSKNYQTSLTPMQKESVSYYNKENIPTSNLTPIITSTSSKIPFQSSTPVISQPQNYPQV